MIKLFQNHRNGDGKSHDGSKEAIFSLLGFKTRFWPTKLDDRKRTSKDTGSGGDQEQDVALVNIHAVSEPIADIATIYVENGCPLSRDARRDRDNILFMLVAGVNLREWNLVTSPENPVRSSTYV